MVDLTLCNCCVIGLSRKTDKIINDIRKDRKKNQTNKRINKLYFSFATKLKAMCFLYSLNMLSKNTTESSLRCPVFLPCFH